MYVKICGITTVEDAEMAARAGADFIGLNFWPESSRHVSLARAADICEAVAELAPDTHLVGVFVNQSVLEIEQAVDHTGLDYVQLHGDEPAESAATLEHVIKAFALSGDDVVDRIASYPCEMVLVDAPSRGYGGSGQLARWDLARRVVSESGRNVFLAGGLTPDNVAAAIAEVGPWAVDVASGVERAPGIKDPDRVRQFIERAKEAGVKGGN